MNPVFIDTNIFMYAAGAAHPHKQPSLQFLSKMSQSKTTVVTNTEVLQEILYRYRKINKQPMGFQIFEKILTIIPIILPITKTDMILGQKLLLKYEKIEPRDAIHAAVMLNRQIKTVCSYDKHFDQIKEVKRITP